MRARSLRGAVLAAVAATTLAVGPAAWARVETFGFTVDRARLASDRHTVVAGGTYTCGPLDLNVVGGGGTVDLTVRQGGVTGFGYVPIQVCDGTTQGYRAEVTTFGVARFTRGPATASVSGEVRGERDGRQVTQRTRITDQPITITRG